MRLSAFLLYLSLKKRPAGKAVTWISTRRKEVYQMSTTLPAIPNVIVPDQFNVATAFLDRNLAEGRGTKIAIYHEGTAYSYAQVAELANCVGNDLLELGVDLEQR